MRGIFVLKWILLTAIFWLSQLKAQDIDLRPLLVHSPMNCYNVSYNARVLIPEYYRKNASDTLQSILDLWKNSCQKSEAFLRVSILLSIADRSFTENIYGEDGLTALRLYQRNQADLLRRQEQYQDLIGSDYLDLETDSFNVFTKQLAKSLVDITGLSAVELYLLSFYGNPTYAQLEAIDNQKYAGTLLYNQYQAERQKRKNQPYLNLALMAGSWTPLGNAALLGTHPFIGFRMGRIKRRMGIDFTMGFRFGKSKSEYEVLEEGTLYKTNHFFGVYFGLDANYTIISGKKLKIQALGGIAFDGFDALDIDTDDNNSDDDITKSLTSLNLNTGLGLARFNEKMAYLALELKYNVVNYKNEGGTDLSGNTITVNLVYGGWTSSFAYNPFLGPRIF